MAVALRRRYLGDDPIGLGESLQHARSVGQFKEFCEAYGLHTRKAYELIRIADAVQRNLLTPADVADIGWTKAAVIARAAGGRRPRRAVAYARKHTMPALVRFLREGEAGGRGQDGLITKSFALTPAEAAELDDALRAAGAKERGGRMIDRSKPIMRIIRTFMSTGTGGGARGRSRVNSDAASNWRETVRQDGAGGGERSMGGSGKRGAPAARS